MYQNGWKKLMGVLFVPWLKRLGMTPQGPTKGPWREPLQFDAALADSVHRWDKRRPVCGSTGSRCHRRPAHRLVEKVPSPAQFSGIIDEMQRHMLHSVCRSTGLRCHRYPTVIKIEKSLVCTSLWPNLWMCSTDHRWTNSSSIEVLSMGSANSYTF